MQTYKIEIIETLSKIVEVPALSSLNAEEIVREQYNSSEIVLDSNDLYDTEFKDITE